MHDVARLRRRARISRRAGDACLHGFRGAQYRSVVPGWVWRERGGEALQRGGHVPNQLMLWEIDGIALRRKGVEVDYGPTVIWAHLEGRLLHDVVANIQDHIGRLNRAVWIVAGHDRRADIERTALLRHAFAHHRGDERNLRLLDQGTEGHRDLGPVGSRAAAHHDERTLGISDQLGRPGNVL